MSSKRPQDRIDTLQLDLARLTTRLHGHLLVASSSGIQRSLPRALLGIPGQSLEDFIGNQGLRLLTNMYPPLLSRPSCMLLVSCYFWSGIAPKPTDKLGQDDKSA
jgi:hypothetical protein